MYLKCVILLFLIYQFPLAKSAGSDEKQTPEKLIKYVWDKISKEEKLIRSGSVLNDVITKQSTLLKEKFLQLPIIPAIVNSEQFKEIMENIGLEDLEKIVKQIEDNENQKV